MEKLKLMRETINRYHLILTLNNALHLLCKKLQSTIAVNSSKGAKSVSIVELESILKDGNYEELNEKVVELEQSSEAMS